MPSCCTTTPRVSISTIFDATRKSTPSGDSLKFSNLKLLIKSWRTLKKMHEHIINIIDLDMVIVRQNNDLKIWRVFNNPCWLLLCELTYQTTQLVIIIMAVERVSKKLSKGFPFSPILPRVMPSTVENTTRPRIFVPGSVDDLIFQVYLSAENTYKLKFSVNFEYYVVAFNKPSLLIWYILP